ncbi:MAG TPA: hypothetical protein ENI86_17080 [Acidimicrobiales bacterium]|nr:hypothetical protein [Acidimicrobiales bacterium]
MIGVGTLILVGFALVVAACGGESNRAADSPWPAETPPDLEVVFSTDGGMVPWSESLTVTPSEARYEVRSDGLSVEVVYTPDPARVNDLYEEVSLGRFDLFEVVPFENDEIIYDAESVSYRVTAGTVRHRLGTSGEEIAGVETDHHPLAAIEGFRLPENVPEAQGVVLVVFDRSVDLYGRNVVMDLRGADVAIGPDSSPEGFELHWSGGDRAMPVEIRVEGEDGELTAVGSLLVDLRSGGEILISVDESGEVAVTP